MIESIDKLWSLMIVFFSEDVTDYPLFQGMFLFLIIFWTIYLFKYIYDEVKRL